MFLLDDNTATGAKRETMLYWDEQDRLITRRTVPDAAVPSAYVLDMVAHVEPAVVGSIRLDFTGGGPFERWFYDVRDPVGLPVVRWEHTWTPGVTSEVWRAEHTPYGDRLAESGDVSLRPPWRFLGQLELEGSDASVWLSGVPTTLRAELCLNQWRVYDPRVGQYLTPEPWALSARNVFQFPHAYEYVGHAPYDYIDPSGEDWLDDIADSSWKNLCALVPGLCLPYPPWPSRECATSPPPPPYPAPPGACVPMCEAHCMGFEGIHYVLCMHSCLAYCRTHGTPPPPQ